MSDVICFLESVGRNSELRHATKDELERALKDAQIDQSLHAVILGSDKQQLEALTGCNSTVCCGVFPGKEEDDETEEEPQKDDDEIRAQSVERQAA